MGYAGGIVECPLGPGVRKGSTSELDSNLKPAIRASEIVAKADGTEASIDPFSTLGRDTVRRSPEQFSATISRSAMDHLVNGRTFGTLA